MNATVLEFNALVEDNASDDLWTYIGAGGAAAAADAQRDSWSTRADEAAALCTNARLTELAGLPAL